MLGDDFSTPIMYRDIGSMSMTPMTMPFGMGVAGGGYPSYLGGQVRMQQQPDSDKFLALKRKDDESKKSMKTALKVFGVFMAVTFAGPLFKSIKKAGGLGGYFSKQFNSLKKLFGLGPKKASTWENVKSAAGTVGNSISKGASAVGKVAKAFGKGFVKVVTFGKVRI